jgi:peptidoglycan-N-acetylglucosamine deacetylase
VTHRRLAILVGLLLLGGGPLPAAAHAASPNLAGVRGASLRQHARRVVWRVSLVRGISPRELRRGRRTLCLLVEPRPRGPSPAALCLAAGPRGLELTAAEAEAGGRGGLGPARAVAAARVRRHGTVILAALPVSALSPDDRSLRWQTASTARSPACPPAPAPGDPGRHVCAAVFPARRRPLARLHVPRLVGCVAHGPSIVYGGPPTRPAVALTFDDGPWGDPASIDFVDELHRLDAPATFFEIGEQISEFDPTGAVQRAMLADGDMIGDHTWTHPDMDALAPAAQTSELELTAQAIRRATGFTPCLWRPPYGSIDSEMEDLARRLGFLTVYWNDDPRDWALPGVASIVDTALAEARDGGIVELHFGGGPREQTLAAIPLIVRALRARGDRLVNLAQLLGVRELWR